MWLYARGRDASANQRWCKDLYPIRTYRYFSEIQRGGRRHLGFSSHVNLPHTGVLVMWYLSSVANLIQISVVATEIDTLMLQIFI